VGQCTQMATQLVYKSPTALNLTPEHDTKVLRILKEELETLGMKHKGYSAMKVHDLRDTFAYLTAKSRADLGDF
jgi:hypothetical protein